LAATHSPYNKPFIAAKVVIVPSLIAMITPALVCLGMSKASSFYTSVHGLASASTVFLIEVLFIYGASKLNAVEIKSKKKGLSDQISELESLRMNETDEVVIRDIDKNLQRLKKDRTQITSNPR
jgi:hypothetical protein